MARMGGLRYAVPLASGRPMANPSAAFEPKAYSVAFEMQLLDEDLDRGRKIHFNRANAALDNAMKANPDFAKMMNDMMKVRFQ